MIKYAIYATDHGSDHQAIETVFDVLALMHRDQERLLFKNAPWKEINARIRVVLETSPAGDTV